MRLPILQRKIARLLSTDDSIDIREFYESYDETAEKIVSVVIDYLHEQSYKKTELDRRLSLVRIA